MHKTIKKQHKLARKSKDAFLQGILSVLLADIEKTTKDLKVDWLDDVKVIEKINYWVKQMDKLMNIYKPNSKAYNQAVEEKKIYLNLLPTQLSKEEIIDIIRNNNLSNIPELMRFFSSNYFGRYNSKEVLQIFKVNL